MSIKAARATFARLMAVARRRPLTAAEHEQLRRASIIIRAEKRGRLNPRKRAYKTRQARGRQVFVTRNVLGDKRTGSYLLVIESEGEVSAFGLDLQDAKRAQLQGAEWVQPYNIADLLAKVNPRKLTRAKARRILHEGAAKGLPLTERQRRFFGARASGYPRRAARKNPARRGLIRMGKLVQLRYRRDHGRQRGFYKHTFKTHPTLFYDPSTNTILAR